MPERYATIESLPVAIEVVKAMWAQGLDWGRAIARLAVGRWPRLSRRRWPRRSTAGWRVGSRGRCGSPQRLLPPLAVDRTQRHQAFFSAHALSIALQRWCAPTHAVREIDRMILSGFVHWLSTRMVGEVALGLPRAAIQPGHGESGGSEPQRGGGGLPHPSAQRPQQGADTRRRRAGPQDGSRSLSPAWLGGSGPAGGHSARSPGDRNWARAASPIR